ncbi:MAG TPA: M1 family aminopeptidase [Kofleriaceae bacterium]|nr:M1 family aminopeptidase [Kofleriaceae bacterium]
MTTRTALALLILLAACGDNLEGGDGGGGGGPDASVPFEPPDASEDWTRDLVSTALEIDLAGKTGRATIAIAASESTGASFEIGDLEVSAVTDDQGRALDFAAADGQLDVGVPATGETGIVVIDYAFKDHEGFDGWMPGQGVTFLWPYFCGNLYPCKSDPADGQTFEMSVTGAEGDVVYPDSIPAEAPTYMPAIAVADFTEIDLGTSSGGTRLSVWHLPGAEQEEFAAQGTEHLLDVFSFFEDTYGPYPFGGKAGTVSADWGGGDYGGMEHHPYWHVSSGSLYSEEVNAHEAAHGWFGNGVRIACWEDFVLSEGLATYMAARALGESGVNLWPSYECDLKRFTCREEYNTIALPDTCNQIDILNDPLWSLVPYMKGAFFLRAVANRIGAEELDQSLAAFYQANVGKAAKMDALIARIQEDHPEDAEAIGLLADRWLRQLRCPVRLANLCTGG